MTLPQQDNRPALSIAGSRPRLVAISRQGVVAVLWEVSVVVRRASVAGAALIAALLLVGRADGARAVDIQRVMGVAELAGPCAHDRAFHSQFPNDCYLIDPADDLSDVRNHVDDASSFGSKAWRPSRNLEKIGSATIRYSPHDYQTNCSKSDKRVASKVRLGTYWLSSDATSSGDDGDTQIRDGQFLDEAMIAYESTTDKKAPSFARDVGATFVVPSERMARKAYLLTYERFRANLLAAFPDGGDADRLQDLKIRKSVYLIVLTAARPDPDSGKAYPLPKGACNGPRG